MKRFACLAVVLLGSWGGVAVAAPKAPAVTDPAAADADFALQGEYWGQASLPGWAPGWTGLQVVAVGDGRFEAVLYEGGLPGAGWNRRTKRTASGLAGEASVKFTTSLEGGETIDLLVDGRSAAATVDRGAGAASAGTLRKVVRVSPLLGLEPTPGAKVLFRDGQADGLDKPRVEEGGLMGIGAATTDAYGDFRLHVEFRLPYAPKGTGQGRGNSGCYLQRRYEVQILDSFGLDPAFNDCGSLYRQRPPAVNMCLPPLAWQTYDIYFTAAKFDAAGTKAAPARLTVVQNGEVIHNDIAIETKTGAGQPEGPAPGPILFQDHGDPVRFRNVWIDASPGHRADLDRVAHALTRGGFTPRVP